MSDLETRVAEGLAGTAERAPATTDLASGARSRLSRRRRTTAVVVAALVAVAAVPIGLALVGDPSDGPTGDSSSAGTPSSWRLETWRDLSLRVPPDWTYEGGLDWCVAGSDAADVPPAVSRPGGLTRGVACRSSYGYGAHFLEPSGGELPPGTEGVVQKYHGERYPDGAWIGYAATGQAAVWVVAADRTTARLVLDSTERVAGVDDNGCATYLSMAAPTGSDRISVCRYDGDGWLEQSELLSEGESRLAVAAVAAAPQAPRSARRCFWERLLERPAITLGSEQFHATVLYQGCRAVDPTGGVVPRELTPDVLYWALSPGWSGTLSFLSHDQDPGPWELRKP